MPRLALDAAPMADGRPAVLGPAKRGVESEQTSSPHSPNPDAGRRKPHIKAGRKAGSHTAARAAPHPSAAIRTRLFSRDRSRR